MAKQITVTINAMLTHESDEDGDCDERGVDLTIPADTNTRQVLAILFDGFADRLAAAGIQIGEVTNFT